jgi:hypothetical protein
LIEKYPSRTIYLKQGKATEGMGSKKREDVI